MERSIYPTPTTAMTTTPAAGAIIPRQDVTGLFDSFIAYLDARPKTVETYGKAIRQFGKYIAERGITNPQRGDVIAFRDSLKEDHAPATVQNYIVAVRLFFRWTAQEGLYPNIADHVKGMKIDKGHRKDYLTARQARAVVSGIDQDDLQGLRDYAIFALMLTAGLRTIEVTRADIADLTVSGGEAVLYIQGKGRDQKTDYVKVSEDAENAIRAYLSARGPVERTAPLFACISNRNVGGRMTTRSVSRIVKTRLQAAGYDSDRLTAHSLRHTCATLNLLNGGSLQETQQLLRHTSISTTTIYAHNLERAKNNSEKRVSKAIFR